MAIQTQDSAQTRAAIWNDPRARAIFWQIVVVILVVAGLWYLIGNVIENRNDQGIASGYGFLEREAGFEISESIISYGAANTYGRAFLVGILNTFIVGALGIVAATIIGTIMGIARLSKNWLIAKVASAYVETVRNIPLLLQLFVWYAVITESMPNPQDEGGPLSILGIAYLSNRGFDIAAPVPDPAFVWMGVAVVIAVIGIIFLRRYAEKQQAATGERLPVLLYSLVLLIGLPLIVWLVSGMPTDWDVPLPPGHPDGNRFRFVGGANVSPEFMALFLGLSIYTAGFIAEIVRSGIQAVPWGQTEAASALGLRRGLVLRLVVLPQALRIIIPPTTSQYLNLVKNSSLAVAIGYPDLVSVGNTTLNQTGQALEAISLFMAVYLIISLAISAFMNWYNTHIKLVER
ncbi:MAG: amino acid ABC transporter permease [Azospirillaceae bacterium]